jgi:hypothetical protein
MPKVNIRVTVVEPAKLLAGNDQGVPDFDWFPPRVVWDQISTFRFQT